MSETDSYKSPEPSEYDPDQDAGSIFEGHYVNERGDRHSEDSSSYHISAKADPTSTNKKYVRRINPTTNKLTKVEFFPTNTTPNSIIKHAMTGMFQSDDGQYYKVGSKDEDFMFSVILATGEMGQNAPVLFYDSPEQYERHFFTELPQSAKDSWNEKRNRAIYNYNAKRAKETATGTILVK